MKVNKKFLAVMVLGTFISATAFASPPPDQNFENKEFLLDQIVVTAQRQEMKDFDTPASVTVVTAKDIERSGASTVYDIIERQVGVSNNAYGPGGMEFGGSNSRTVIRGLDKGTLVMVNGAPINMLNYNSMEGIPIESVERVEIVRGANSVLYGSEAFGGVINIITKRGGTPGSSVEVGAGNYNKKYSVSNSGENYTLFLSRDDYGTVDQTNRLFSGSKRLWRFQEGTKDSAFLTVKLNEQLDFNYSHVKGDYIRDDVTLKNGKPTGAGTRYEYEDTRDNTSLIYQDKENQMRSALSYNRREVDPSKAAVKDFIVGPLEESTSSNWKMSTTTWDTQKAWDLADGADKLVAGITLNREEMTDRGKKADADRKGIALYSAYTRAFRPDFSATVGLRGQFIDDYAKDQSVFLPQLQTLYKLNETTSWYTNIGKSFQMPALNQYFTAGRTDQLKPQEGWTYETGFKWLDGNSAWKAAIFHMDIDGKFDWVKKEVTGLDDDILINAGKFKNTGIELEYNKKISDIWRYKLGMSYSNPKTQGYNSSEWVQSNAKLQYTAGIEYQKEKLTSSLNYLYLGKREDSYYAADGSTAKIPDHRVPTRQDLNLSLNYQADQDTVISLTVNNILDKDNAINKFENWGMPLNWMLKIKHSF